MLSRVEHKKNLTSGPDYIVNRGNVKATGSYGLLCESNLDG